jgi:hypothetical protein
MASIAVAVVDHAALLETKPHPQAGDEAVTLRQAVEFVDDAAVHQAKDAGIGRTGEIGHASEQWVEQAESDPAHAALAPPAALAQHHLVALAPLLDHVRDDLRRVLQVAVDEDDALSARRMHARRHGRLMTKIPR